LSDFEYLVKLFSSKKVTVILSVGWEDGFSPDKYSKMARKEEDRKIFVASVMDIINEYNLDGFLIYWELVSQYLL